MIVSKDLTYPIYIMENWIIGSEVEDDKQLSLPSNPEKSDINEIKPTLKQRFFTFNSLHNRINRSWFFLNIVFFGIISYGSYYFLKWTVISSIGIIIISLIFGYMYFIQVKKRCHDFGNSWNILTFFLFLITLSPIWIQYIFYLLPSWVFGYVNFMLQYGIYLVLSTILLWIIFTLIRWNSEKNEYGIRHIY